MCGVDRDKLDLVEYNRGRHAAQLAEDCPTGYSWSFWVGYLDEVHNPSGGLTPQ